MCQSFEKEDIIQSYIPWGRPVSTLSASEVAELMSQADASLKRAKGKAYMPQITKSELLELLAHLPRDARRMYSFHGESAASKSSDPV